MLMGNEAIALGAIRAGVGFVSGYPGTPSTEVLETVARNNPGDIYVEWSVNEKSALEAAAGAAYAGMRSMVTMKQVGLNVASDPLMSLAYIGVKGGMVVMVADDPGPISSQTEQDTRTFALFSKLPIFDPATAEDAYEMIGDAFEYSEKYQTPVLFRPTTRICHSRASIETVPERRHIVPEGFVKDSKWVIFPKLSYESHLKIEARRPVLAEDFSSYRFNRCTGRGTGRRGIVTGGVTTVYAQEALSMLGAQCPFLRVATPHPFPEPLALEFLQGLDEVLVLEELDPALERSLLQLCGQRHLPVVIRGKLTGDTACAGENSAESCARDIGAFLGLDVPEEKAVQLPSLPVRPPVLCAGCPHRASFYAVKQAMKGRKAVFCGDIGCYTLGNAKPLDMTDTCLCMGAGVTVAQGLQRAEPDAVHFAFIGDSTFFHTGIPGVVNAVYNQTDMILVVLDNSTTAMTGHQPHPGTGRTVMGEITRKVSITRILEAMDVKIFRADPLDLKTAVETVRAAAAEKGVKAILFESPCIAVVKPRPAFAVDPAKCIGCMRCIRELGCPAISAEGKQAVIEASMCYGCSLCSQVCPCGAIERRETGREGK